MDINTTIRVLKSYAQDEFACNGPSPLTEAIQEALPILRASEAAANLAQLASDTAAMLRKYGWSRNPVAAMMIKQLYDARRAYVTHLADDAGGGK